MPSPVVIIGAGPYGLSLSAHLAARGIEHRIFGQPMRFWTQIANAGGERYLKSFCFGTNLSISSPGYTFADYNGPRGREIFEPCTMEDFAAYGLWFQQLNVPNVEQVDVTRVTKTGSGFVVALANGETCSARVVVIATGLTYFAKTPRLFASIPGNLATHTSEVNSFSSYAGKTVAVIGGGQSALEAAALLFEAGARPQILVRDEHIRWQTRTLPKRSLWRRIRSPISGLGSGPIAWALTHFPGATYHMPDPWRSSFVKKHLPAEGAWWLRKRVENRLPIHLGTRVIDVAQNDNGLRLHLRGSGDSIGREIMVDCAVLGTGYVIDVDRIAFLHPQIRGDIKRTNSAPRLNAVFEASIPGLHFIGALSAMSFGPLFRFVVGADYTARTLSSYLDSQHAKAGG